MLTWKSERLKTEQDDPYSAWDYARRANRRDGAPSQAICPVLIELLPTDYPDASNPNSKEIKHLLKSLEHIRCRIEDPKDEVLASADELQLLKEKEAQLLRQPKRASHKYFRVILVYVPEDKFYPRKKSPFQENEYFRILLVGKAIPGAFIEGIDHDGVSSHSAIPDGNSLIGIIDDSFAFLNDALIEGGQSLFNRIFFQDRETVINGTVARGVEVNQKALQKAIARKTHQTEAEIYRQPIETAHKKSAEFLAIDSSSEKHQPLAFPISHGTHVTDTAVRAFKDAAAGAKAGGTLSLFGVAVPTEVTQDTSGQTLSTYLLLALRRILLWADRDTVLLMQSGNKKAKKPSPLVINFSYGYPAGAKDGFSKLNRLIAEMIDGRNELGFPTALVVPMGNSANDQSVVASRTVTKGAPIEVDWVIEPDDRTDNYIEIFARGSDIRIELLQPSGAAGALKFDLDGRALGRLVPGYVEKDVLVAGAMAWSLDHLKERRWQRQGFIALGPTRSIDHPNKVVPSGTWKLRITNIGKGKKAEVLAMIQRDDAPGSYPEKGRQSYFDHSGIPIATADVALDYGQYSGGPITKSNTASVFTAIKSKYVYAVGAGMGDAGDEVTTPVQASPYASRGPRPGVPPGPDATALADRSEYFRGIYAAGTYSGTQFAMSGASVAAPQFAGYLAANPKMIGQPAKAIEKALSPRYPQKGKQGGAVLAPGNVA